MFFGLFLKECKQIFKSTTYYLFVIIMVIFYFTQTGGFTDIAKPLPNQESYGTRDSENENEIMESTLGKLLEDWYQNTYIAYPTGFYKKISLNESKADEVGKILEEATGKSQTELKGMAEKENPDLDPSSPILTQEIRIVQPDKNLTYTHFIELMGEVDTLIGGGKTSSFAKNKLGANVQVPITYEEALKEYEDILKIDRITNEQARVFSDYLGIMLAILPVFISVTRGLRDKRAGAVGVIYSKKASSIAIIGSRYLSTIVMSVLPLFILAISPTLEGIYYGNSIGVEVDTLAYFTHIAGWLMPSMLAAVSVGFFLTELTDSALGILVQGIWWYISLNLGVQTGLQGSFGLTLIPRWNAGGGAEDFAAQLPQLVVNRLFYMAFSIILMAGTIVIFQLKRKGTWKVNGILFRNRKSKSEA